MERFVCPALFAILLWWVSTGVVLFAVNRDRSGTSWSVAAATALLLLGGFGLYASAWVDSLPATYIGFASALLVWAWHEVTFLSGTVTGPWTRPASRHVNGRAPLWEAISTVIYHEFAIAITAAMILAACWNAPNMSGVGTFLILWLLRLSAKINIYLGVPNITEEFLPAQLTYLKTYFCRRPMNMFFPVSVTLTTVAVVLMAISASDDSKLVHEAAAISMLMTLLLLALAEHWFLVLPFDSTRLWAWANRGEDHVTQIGLARAAEKPSPEPNT